MSMSFPIEFWIYVHTQKPRALNLIKLHIVNIYL